MEEGAAGLCPCQEDSYLRTLVTTVLSCQPAPAPSGKAAKASASASAPGPRYEVVLQTSPMYPEGGGQPCDTGSLNAPRPTPGGPPGQLLAQVYSVQRRAGGAEGLVHVTDCPLEVGSQVEVAVEWRRRYDHMQQHSGQHVVSAVAELLVGAATASWELHPTAWEELDSVAVDLSVPDLTAEQISAIEARCNEEVRAQRAVRQLVLEDGPGREERLQQLSRDPSFRGQLPPSDKIKGPLRLVEVQGLDINACGGTHVRSTGELQLVKVVGVERTRGMARLRFVAGDRALAALGRCLLREGRLTAKLTVPPAEHEGFVEGLLKDRREGSKQRKALAQELAALLGAQLLLQGPQGAGAQAQAQAGAAGPEPGAGADAASTSVDAAGAAAASAAVATCYHRPGADLEFLSAMATSALEACPQALLLLTSDNTDPALQPPSAQQAAAAEVTFLLAGPAERVKVVGPLVAAALGGRGGGRPGRYQGKAPGALPRLPEAQALLLQPSAPA